MKVFCCEIINNCLEYPFIKGLTLNGGLENCLYVIENADSSPELRDEALRSVLRTAEKEKSVPE